jgi:hypothetical protein
LYWTIALGRPAQAAGIEAAATAEQFIADCRELSFFQRPKCLNYSLNRRWKEELGYTGKPFSAIGRLEGVRTSLAGNLFAFVMVDAYRVACKITKSYGDRLRGMDSSQTVLISGVIDSYYLTFDLHRFHHLRLTPYCTIEAVG